MQRDILIGHPRSIDVQPWASGGGHSAGATRRIADRSIELLRPFIEATIVEPGVSHDRALVIVLLDPAVRDGTSFEEAILARYAFGRAEDVSVDYARHALDKARASYRERQDTSVLRERDAALLTADLPLVGGLHRRGWTVGVSGAAPAFDEAIGAIVIELLHALQTRSASAGGPSSEARIA